MPLQMDTVVSRARASLASAGLTVVGEEAPMRSYAPGEVLHLELGERHRPIGLETWGVIAELWQHTDAASPSDELDIVRVADDHDRT
jgi:hypothetical protein